MDKQEQEQIKNSLTLIQFPNKANENSLIFLGNEQGEVMPGIKKRADGRFEVRKMENGTRKSIYTKTLQEALKIKNKFIKNKIKIEPKDKEVKQYKLKDWILTWEEKYKKPFIKKKSLRDIHGSLKKVITSLGEIKLKDITTMKLQEFMNSLKKNRTKERTQLYLNAVLEKACNLDLIKKNPFKAVEKVQKGIYKNDAYKYAEQETILKIIKNTDIECEILIYLLTGVRPAEFPNKDNIDLNNKIIHIYGTKNKKSIHREIEISENFAEYLKEHLKNHEIKKYSSIQKKFKKLCEINGIKKPLLYKLRHTFASNHFVLKTHIKQVSYWMGHKSIKITLDTYTDIDKTATKDKILKLYNNFYYINN